MQTKSSSERKERRGVSASIRLKYISGSNPNWVEKVRNLYFLSSEDCNNNKPINEDFMDEDVRDDMDVTDLTDMMGTLGRSIRKWERQKLEPNPDSDSCDSDYSSHSSCSTKSSALKSVASTGMNVDHEPVLQTTGETPDKESTPQMKRKSGSPFLSQAEESCSTNLLDVKDCLDFKLPSPSIVKSQGHDVDVLKKWLICGAYLNGACKSEKKCGQFHPKVKRSYCWIYKFVDENKWYPLTPDDNDFFEVKYCDPAKFTIKGFQMSLESKPVKTVKVDVTFLNYVVGESVSDERAIKFHRLGVRGLADVDSWAWYWKNSTTYSTYGVETDGKVSTIDSEYIETIFHRMNFDTTKQVQFDVGDKSGYILSLNKTSSYDSCPFVQQSPSAKRVRLVIRRPFYPKWKSSSIKLLPAKESKDAQQICQSHSTQPCSKRECPLFHYKGNYLWVFKEQDEIRWSQVPVDRMKKLELDFLDPSVSSVKISLGGRNCVVKFRRNGEIFCYDHPGLKVRRLCYDTQKWTWYREPLCEMNKDKTGAVSFSAFPAILSRIFNNQVGDPWTEYKRLSGTVDSAVLENAFRDDRASLTYYNQYNFVISFSTFEETCTEKEVVRAVRRRPFVDQMTRKEVEARRGNVAIPSDWLTNSGFSVFPLEPERSLDYRIIAKSVFSEIPTASFVNVHRIENHNLWKLFNLKRKQLVEKLGWENFKEALLFHGIAPGIMEKIAQSNQDFRLTHDVSGKRYGSGSYFSPDFKYAAQVASMANDGSYDHNNIVVALVLIGESCLGDVSYKIPPPKISNGDLIDSCHGESCKEHNREVVVFDDNQVYPLFVIVFG